MIRCVEYAVPRQDKSAVLLDNRPHSDYERRSQRHQAIISEFSEMVADDGSELLFKLLQPTAYALGRDRPRKQLTNLPISEPVLPFKKHGYITQTQRFCSDMLAQNGGDGIAQLGTDHNCFRFTTIDGKG